MQIPLWASKLPQPPQSHVPYFLPTWQVHKQQSFHLGLVTQAVQGYRTWLTKTLPLHGGQIGGGESGWRSRCQSLYPTQNSLGPWALCVQTSPGKKIRELPLFWMQVHIPEFYLRQMLVPVCSPNILVIQHHPTNFSLLLSAHSCTWPSFGLVSSCSNKNCMSLLSRSRKHHQLLHAGVSSMEGAVSLLRHMRSKKSECWHWMAIHTKWQSFLIVVL